MSREAAAQLAELEVRRAALMARIASAQRLYRASRKRIAEIERRANAPRA